MTTTTYPEDFLRQYVYNEVWCAPGQDSQRVFEPERMSPKDGVWNTFLVGWRRYDLPTKNDRYHIYHMGQVYPDLIGLIDEQRRWYSMRYLCETLNAFADVYLNRGITLPRAQCYYMVTEERLLVLAVRIPDKRLINVDLNTEPVYIRVYLNKFFRTQGNNQAGLSIECQSKVSTSQADILTMQNRIDALAAQPGKVLSYVNGFLVNKVSLLTAQPGDNIGFIYDPSIKFILTFKVDELHEFLSERDTINKYLLHHPYGDDTIDYYDDVDVYVLNKPSNQVFRGLLYHKNMETRLRNATHCDYVISSQGVTDLYQHFTTPLTHDKAYVQLVVRNGSSDRQLVFEANRIKDMYRMNDTDVYRSMVGIDANVPGWNVATLENSDYMHVMSAEYGTITRQQAFDALGYNAISKLLGDTPLRYALNSGQKIIDVPVGLRESCTAYEYDAAGKLLGWHHHTNNATHVAQHPNADLVELIYGEGTTSFDDVAGQQTSMLDKRYNYRFYLSTKNGGVVQNNWQDVSGSANYHVFETGQVQWAINSLTQQPLVRSNKKHLVYEFTHPMEDGNLQFNITTWNAVTQQWEILHIPPAQIDIWVNGWNLIPGVDYVRRGLGIYVTSKEYLINPGVDLQNIVVRGIGFCQNDMTLIAPGDTGFVKHGVLSSNNVYDIRDDKVNRIIVGGALYRYDELEYAESDGTVRVTDPLNGKPYMVSDILVPMNNFQESAISNIDPTLIAREDARVIDKQISDYLTMKLPERELGTPSTFVAKYRLFSPFFTKLFAALDSGQISGEWMYNFYNEQKVKAECAQFEYLLDWDPLIDANAIDPTFTTIHPHPYMHVLTLNPYQYKFMQMAVKVYGQGKINLSAHAVISS